MKHAIYSSIGLLFIGLLLGSGVQMVRAAGAPLPPMNLVVQNDDHVARVSWTAPTDNSVVGYKVTWGISGNLNTSFFTGYTAANIQPLLNATTYQVEVQSVDASGILSAILGPANAQTDPTRVNNIRALSTAQFDDFNSGQPVDPTHWFTSYNNADPSSSVFPMSSQAHLHLFTKNLPVTGHTLRATATMRALQPFDFTNRTGTVYFDFDWGTPPGPVEGVSSRRYVFYLSISPTLADDISYRANAPAGSAHIATPGVLFQIEATAERIEFRKFVGGILVNSWINTNLSPSLRTINVRKHSIFKLSQNAASLTIDGTTILDARGINLSFQKGYVYLQQLVYQISGDHIPYVLSHWDNIGFDAPTSGYAPEVIHTYTDGSSVNSDEQSTTPASFAITIPDALTGESAQRLFMDVQTSAGNVKATVTVNGSVVPWALVGPADTQAFDAHVMSMPPGTLHQGSNVISVSANCGCTFRVENVHVEVAFPYGSTTPYTAYSGAMGQMVPGVAPLVAFGVNAPKSGSTVHGIIPVEVTGDGMYSLLPTGHVDAVVKLEVLVDGVVMATFNPVGPTVRTDQVLNLDTTKLANGPHKITVSVSGQDGLSMSSDAPILQNATTSAYNYRTVVVSN